MLDSPQKPEGKRPKDGFTAVEIARANLSYEDPPSISRPWRKIAILAILPFLTLVILLLARYFDHTQL